MFSSSAEEVFKISMLVYLARRPTNRLIRWRGDRYIPKNSAEEVFKISMFGYLARRQQIA
jgi:hypothetical protein